MSQLELRGRLGQVEFDGELPRRADLGLVFDELDYQMACQVYLWALPLVSYAQWRRSTIDVFGATSSDLVRYLSYRDRLGLITANATTPYILNFFDLSQTGSLVIELPPGPTAGGISDFWQRECAVLGELGPDRGQGGRHLVVPPGQDAPRSMTARTCIRRPGSTSCSGSERSTRIRRARRRWSRRCGSTPTATESTPADPDRLPGRAGLER